MLVRGFNSTVVADHAVGAIVELLAPVSPSDSLMGGGIQESPDLFNAGIGPDGFLHCFFIPSRDPLSSDFLRDENGETVSIWVFDTGTGEVSNPTGFPVLNGLSSDPGALQLTRLLIDSGVTLRVVGPNPASFQVTEVCEISGTVDASGFDGQLRLSGILVPTTP